MLGLYVYKHDKTKTIDAAWSMSVWHEEGRKIILTKPDCQKTFFKKSHGYASHINESLPGENNFIVTINMSNWNVTNY